MATGIRWQALRMSLIYLQWLAALLPSVLLLVYDVALTARIVTGGAGHVGGDIVFACYSLAALGVFGASSLCWTASAVTMATSSIRRWLLGLSVFTAAFWLVLHMGGLIFSHESMVANRYQSSLLAWGRSSH